MRKMPRNRYVPRATNERGGWALFDRKLDRFITDEELDAISEETLKNEQLPATED